MMLTRVRQLVLCQLWCAVPRCAMPCSAVLSVLQPEAASSAASTAGHALQCLSPRSPTLPKCKRCHALPNAVLCCCAALRSACSGGGGGTRGARGRGGGRPAAADLQHKRRAADGGAAGVAARDGGEWGLPRQPRPLRLQAGGAGRRCNTPPPAVPGLTPLPGAAALAAVACCVAPCRSRWRRGTHRRRRSRCSRCPQPRSARPGGRCFLMWRC